MNILLLDIETTPITAYTWGLWQQNINLNQIIESSQMLCYAAKWHGKKTMYFDSIFNSSKNEMLKGLHKLLDSADVIVHYNGSSFDIPVINKEFIQSNLLPPSPYKQVDLLKTVRSQFRFPSNKLDYVSQTLGLGNKVSHEGFDLWVKCMEKDPSAWKRMEKYNKQDVNLLEKLYIHLLPWIKNHPNRNLYNQGHVCPKCGSYNIRKNGTVTTLSGRYQRYQCLKCGSWSTNKNTIY
jgi:uncharacterized protein YprB with RNaseH-like and TPR domain/predicted RNA-binding Zn-ribbon protein involved in translation (DUF1610 family)